jgi:hypothetical protein
MTATATVATEATMTMAAEVLGGDINGSNNITIN